MAGLDAARDGTLKQNVTDGQRTGCQDSDTRERERASGTGMVTVPVEVQEVFRENQGSLQICYHWRAKIRISCQI